MSDSAASAKKALAPLKTFHTKADRRADILWVVKNRNSPAFLKYALGLFGSHPLPKDLLFHLACHEAVDTIDWALREKLPLTDAEEDGHAAVTHAIGSGYLTTLMALIKGGISIPSDATLTACGTWDRPVCLKFLLEAGAPLHLGCVETVIRMGYLDALNLLMESGASVSPDATLLACSLGRPKMLKYLLEAGVAAHPDCMAAAQPPMTYAAQMREQCAGILMARAAP